MRRRPFLVVGILVALIILAAASANFYLELLWFEELQAAHVFWTQYLAKWGLRLAAWLFLFLFVLINLLFTRRHILRMPNLGLRGQLLASGAIRLLTPRRVTNFFIIFAAVFSYLFSSYAGGYWMEALQYLHRTPFDVADPIFGADVSLYVFQLPFYRFIYGFLMMALVTTLIMTAIIYFLLNPPTQVGRRWFFLPFTGLSHLSLLLAGVMGLKAWDYRLQQLELVLSGRGTVFGAGYTDIHANLPVLKVLTVLAALIALMFIANIFWRRPRLIMYSLLALIGVSVLGGWAYPAALQTFRVEPAELALEKPYLEHNINFTRQAYGLDRISYRSYPAAERLTWKDLLENPGTMNNVRLWDYRPLLTTLNELQAIRPYYQFYDVDVDRYTVDGDYRQVMLAARELEKSRLDAAAQTWVNMRLQFTHGYGVTVSPVNEVTAEGRPRFFVQDVPPLTTGDLVLTQPAIYYGERTNDYVIVNSRTREFDYPTEEGNAYTTYEGEGGIPLGNILRRLLFAFKFGDYRLLISGELSGESRIMFDRNINRRVKKLAPFLFYDEDPYLAIHDGRLFWIYDAYTVSNQYPYASPYNSPYGRINYIRNAVKVVIDAYNGDVRFFVVDAADPLIRTYSAIFPGLFKPMAEMPAGLAAHIRYPEGLFNLQARVLTMYHVTDANIFYAREDLWDIPVEKYHGKEQPVEPYFIVLQLPGYQSEEFVLLLPFTPARRNNMIALMVARCDQPHYGQIEVFTFPKERLILGPKQVEDRIDQNTEISEQLTLWDQAGSNVLRGNLLVLPVSDSLLYVEPLFLEAAGGGQPELARVIVVFQEMVVMERTLEAALLQIFGERVTPPGEEEPLPPDEPGEPPGMDEPPAGSDLAGLIRQAGEVFEQAQERQRQGDWAGYGEKIKELERILSDLAEMVE